MKFYLGTAAYHWLGLTDVPLFVSRRRLMRRTISARRIQNLPRALGRWALDSGGFTELNLFGKWQTPATQYADEAMLFMDRIGGLDWAAPQDWMCEPYVLQKTGLTVRDHQDRTVASYLELRSLAPQVPWVPVLQGWKVDDYLDHLDQYGRAGLDLARFDLVGVGSVCRRQSTDEARVLFLMLSQAGLRCHGFGFKLQGLARCGACMASSDSMAWSSHARRRQPLPGCRHAGKCTNCLRYALAWRERALAVQARCDPSLYGVRAL